MVLLTLSRNLFGLDDNDLSRMTILIQGPSMFVHVSRVTLLLRSSIPPSMSFYWGYMFAIASIDVTIAKSVTVRCYAAAILLLGYEKRKERIIDRRELQIHKMEVTDNYRDDEPREIGLHILVSSPSKLHQIFANLPKFLSGQHDRHYPYWSSMP